MPQVGDTQLGEGAQLGGGAPSASSRVTVSFVPKTRTTVLGVDQEIHIRDV